MPTSVAWAVRHYRAQGWTVEDVGSTECYDLRCTREGALASFCPRDTSGLPLIEWTRPTRRNTWSPHRGRQEETHRVAPALPAAGRGRGPRAGVATDRAAPARRGARPAARGRSAVPQH